MESARWWLLLVAAVMFSMSGCASKDQWVEWRAHPTHFASGDHGFFSLRNREGSATKVTRADVATARDQGWWGKAITVSQSAILEN